MEMTHVVLVVESLSIIPTENMILVAEMVIVANLYHKNELIRKRTFKSRGSDVSEKEALRQAIQAFLNGGMISSKEIKYIDIQVGEPFNSLLKQILNGVPAKLSDK